MYIDNINLRTKFDEKHGRISDPQNFGQEFVDWYSNPRPDIKILGREFQICG